MSPVRCLVGASLVAVGCAASPPSAVTSIPPQPPQVPVATAGPPPPSLPSSHPSSSEDPPANLLDPACSPGAKIHLTIARPIENQSGRPTADIERQFRAALGKEAATRPGTAVADDHVAGRCALALALVVSLVVTAQPIAARLNLSVLDGASRKQVTALSRVAIVGRDPKRGPDQGGAVLEATLGHLARNLVRMLDRLIDPTLPPDDLEDML